MGPSIQIFVITYSDKLMSLSAFQKLQFFSGAYKRKPCLQLCVVGLYDKSIRFMIFYYYYYCSSQCQEVFPRSFQEVFFKLVFISQQSIVYICEIIIFSMMFANSCYGGYTHSITTQSHNFVCFPAEIGQAFPFKEYLCVCVDLFVKFVLTLAQCFCYYYNACYNILLQK